MSFEDPGSEKHSELVGGKLRNYFLFFVVVFLFLLWKNNNSQPDVAKLSQYPNTEDKGVLLPFN